MKSNPFPEVSSSEELADVWTASYVECSRCVDMTPAEDVVDLVEWAKAHTRLRPWHTTFRTHRITNFSVAGTTNVSTPIVDLEPDAPADAP